jgi:hypothetical protein
MLIHQKLSHSDGTDLNQFRTTISRLENEKRPVLMHVAVVVRGVRAYDLTEPIGLNHAFFGA